MLVGAELEQNLHVAGVRRLAVCGVVTQRRAPQDLGHQAVLEHRQPPSPRVLGNLRRPEPAGLCRGADRRKLRFEREEPFVQPRLERLEFTDQFLGGADEGKE